MSSPEEKPPLGPRANRLWAHAEQKGITLDRVASEIASGLNESQRTAASAQGGTILV